MSVQVFDGSGRDWKIPIDTPVTNSQRWITEEHARNVADIVQWDATIVVTTTNPRFVFQDRHGNDIVLENDHKWYSFGKPYGIDMLKEFEHHMAHGATNIFVWHDKDMDELKHFTPRGALGEDRPGWHGMLCFYNRMTDKKTEYVGDA